MQKEPMKMSHQVTCPACGKAEFSRELAVTDRRTGKKAAGSGTLIFGIILVAIAVFLFVLIVPLWNDRQVPGRQYIYLPIVLLIGGVPMIYSYLKADRVKKIVYTCASCGKTMTRDEIGGAKSAGLEARAKREKVRTADSINKFIWIGSVIVAVLAVAFIFLSRATTERKPAYAKAKVAVLPFVNLGLPGDDDLAADIAEAITARLAGIEELIVIPHHSVGQYKDSHKTAGQISQELGAAYLLFGSIQSVKSEGTDHPIRMSFQLIRAIDDSHLWAEVFERDLAELSRVESDIAAKVAARLGAAVREPAR
jgi:TolB-like protein/predicted RNA-binding Zn-ribbon protein involved in translation (DUF1610 family)